MSLSGEYEECELRIWPIIFFRCFLLSFVGQGVYAPQVIMLLFLFKFLKYEILKR